MDALEWTCILPDDGIAFRRGIYRQKGGEAVTLRPLSCLIMGCRESGDIVAWQSGKAIPYEQFLTDVRCVANTFSAYSTAALICNDSYNFMVGFFGLLCVGARLVLPPSNQTAVLEALRDRFEMLVDDVAIENACRRQPCLSLEPLQPTLPVIDFFTSGSTGAPKCVTKSLAMFDRELAVFEKLYGCALGAGTVFATVPHQHVYGITFKLLWPLATGRAFTAEIHALWESLLSEITESSIIVSSPAHLSRLAGLEVLPAHRRPKLVLSAGAPLTRTASDETTAILGCRPLEIFGSTETGALASRLRQNEEEPWQLLPGVSARCNEEGRMSVCTPFIGPEWIETSDFVELTDGGFHYRGRTDRIVKIEGKRIALANVEEALQNHPYIRKAALVMLGEPTRLAAAVITNNEGKNALEKQGAFRFSRSLKKSLRTVIDPAGIPRVWRFVDALPCHSMGKQRDADIASLFCEAP